MDKLEKEMIDVVNRNHKWYRDRDIRELARKLNAISARRKKKAASGCADPKTARKILRVHYSTERIKNQCLR